MSQGKLPDLSAIFSHVPAQAVEYLPDLPNLPELPGGEAAADVTIPTQAADHLPDLSDINTHAHLPDFLA